MNLTFLVNFIMLTSLLSVTSFLDFVKAVRYERHPDSDLHLAEILSKYGYPVEDHFVTTQDGYILRMFRVPHGRNRKEVRASQKPVLLMHGLLGSADNWMATPTVGLVYQLADTGYDVWLANARGNMHSRNHTTLSPDNHRQFWMFSFHEIGVYDLATKIDYILKTTKKNKLQYIGHSQGGTILFVLLSERPEYNNKIKYATLLAPNVITRNLESPLLLLLPYRNLLIEFLEQMRIYEIVPFNPLLLKISEAFCEEVTVCRPICLQIFKAVGGSDLEEIDPKLMPFIASRTPAGASTRQAYHYLQLFATGDFGQYDHGKEMNMIKYNQSEPPLYNISNTIIPVYIFYGDSDILVGPKDIEELGRMLPNVMIRKMKSFNHFDFLISKNLEKIVYKSLIEMMDRYEKA